MTETREGILHLELSHLITKIIDPKGIVIQEIYSGNNNYTDKGDNRPQRFRNQSRWPERSLTNRGPRVTSRPPSRHNDRCFKYRHHGHFAKECLNTFLRKGFHMVNHISKHKGYPYHYGDECNADEKEVMATM